MMTMAVYRVTPDGKRIVIREEHEVTPIKTIPLVDNWPPRRCPRHRLHGLAVASR
ncbi:hypothetical protein KYY02_03885 [Streptomyces pimonensis]|uniref:Uncharacterized protein n=1 Tax=Streptomyces pimonensis TaxID=2860288 RepID=A0ABV4ITB2_9ACTN